MLKINVIKPVITNEVVRALRIVLSNNKSLTVGFAADKPDFMICRTDGVTSVTTKTMVIKNMTGHIIGTDLKKLGVEMDNLRPVVAGKSSYAGITNQVTRTYKAHCARCGVGLPDSVIDFCNRKLAGNMTCFTCQHTPIKPPVEGASVASASSPQVKASAASVTSHTPSTMEKGTGDEGFTMSQQAIDLINAAREEIKLLDEETQKREMESEYLESISLVSTSTDVTCTKTPDANVNGPVF